MVSSNLGKVVEMRSPVFGPVCGLLLVSSAIALSQNAGPVPPGWKITKSFVLDGETLALEKSRGDGLLVSSKPLEPGSYAFRAEYRTRGIDRSGKLAIDVKTADWKKALSSYESEPPATEWAPTRVFFQATEKTNVLIRLGNLRNAQDTAKVWLRNLSIQPFEMEPGVNLLVNGDWERGATGDMPPMWEWRTDPPVPASCGLVRNTSFREGRHVLRLVADGKVSPVLYSHAFPLPDNGEIEFSLWARSQESAPVKLYVIRQDWGNYVAKSFQPLANWKKFSARWKIKKDARTRFFVRLDLAAKEGRADIADAQVIWHPAAQKDGPKAAGTAELETWSEKFARLGWQGVPGSNLVDQDGSFLTGSLAIRRDLCLASGPSSSPPDASFPSRFWRRSQTWQDNHRVGSSFQNPRGRFSRKLPGVRRARNGLCEGHG